MRVHWPEEPDFPSPDAWDEFVSASPNGHLLQSWAWGELKGRFGWRPVRLAVGDGERLLASAQVLLRPLPYRCLAYVPRGPVVAAGGEEAGRALLPALHRVARSCGAITLKVEPGSDDSPEVSRWWQTRGFHPSAQTVQPRSTIVVDLQPDEEAILAQMNSKTRYAIRTAMKREVTVRRGSAADARVFVDLLQETSERQSFGVHAPDYYQAAFQLFAPAGRAALLLAYYQDQPLAGVMALAFGRQAIYMFGASSERERARMPNQLLQWEAMRWAKAQGCRVYEMWGASSDAPGEGDPLQGVHRFKEGFGGRFVRRVGAWDYPLSGPLYQAYTAIMPRYLDWLRRRHHSAKGDNG
jgi:peptidoglycan pentaglycine glycine transferase (the first glycine)